MPTLDWLNRDEAFRLAERVPTRAQIASMPKKVEKGEVSKLWAARSDGRCLFAIVFKEMGGMGVAQQLDASITVPR